jgi:hypothetical protein
MKYGIYLLGMMALISANIAVAEPCSGESTKCLDVDGNWVTYDDCNQCAGATDDAGNWYYYGICVVHGSEK